MTLRRIDLPGGHRLLVLSRLCPQWPGRATSKAIPLRYVSEPLSKASAKLLLFAWILRSEAGRSAA
jgi:hypothetical protein